jgi:hypothetical protein
MRRIFTIVVLIFAAACGIYFLDRVLFISRFIPNPLRSAICEVVRSRPDSPFALAKLTSFDWDKVYVVVPFTNEEEVRQMLGYSWSDFSRTGISYSDGFNLLVFVKSGRVVNYLRQPRNCGDFEVSNADLRVSGIERSRAIFSVIEVDYGEPWLVVRPVEAQRR